MFQIIGMTWLVASSLTPLTIAAALEIVDEIQLTKYSDFSNIELLLAMGSHCRVLEALLCANRAQRGSFFAPDAKAVRKPESWHCILGHQLHAIKCGVTA